VSDPRAAFMAQAIRLAQKAEGRTAPNPPVGAIVVREGRVVGRGFHHAAGTPHAEPLALDMAGEAARGADLYVTLEPCNHQGRTPPCTQKIISSKIRRVFIGALDPNPGVAGGGAAFLSGQGIQVESGILEERCRELIGPFAKLITTGRPLVCLKLAASLDGRIAPRPGKAQWLTGKKAGAWVHSLRNRSEAIMVGRSTVSIDDPSLTTRLNRGRGQNPLRVILDSRLSISPESKVVAGSKQGGPAGGGCLILTGPDHSAKKRLALERAGAEVVELGPGPGGVDLGQALEDLGRRGVMRLLLEGGPGLAGSFFRAGFVDEIFFLYAPLVMGGAQAPGMVAGPLLESMEGAARMVGIKTRRLGPDVLLQAKVVEEKD
jgi:diaminohydroxyphosphoribosylaminopyrimidine deaminase/5-amino-6-(5-phosphoribosylamino)uracil reductase